MNIFDRPDRISFLVPNIRERSRILRGIGVLVHPVGGVALQLRRQAVARSPATARVFGFGQTAMGGDTRCHCHWAWFSCHGPNRFRFWGHVAFVQVTKGCKRICGRLRLLQVRRVIVHGARPAWLWVTVDRVRATTPARWPTAGAAKPSQTARPNFGTDPELK